MRASQKGNELMRFEDLYKEYYPGVAATVRRFKFTDGAADDLIQEVFLQAWQNLVHLKDAKAFGAWLMTIARNRCLNELRKQKPMVSISSTDSFSENDDHEEIVLIADDDFASLHFEHSLSLLRKLIVAHKGEPRATIARMFYLDHRSVKDISDDLQLKPSTTLSHLRRFRLVVAKAMLQLMEEGDVDAFSEL